MGSVSSSFSSASVVFVIIPLLVLRFESRNSFFFFFWRKISSWKEHRLRLGEQDIVSLKGLFLQRSYMRNSRSSQSSKASKIHQRYLRGVRNWYLQTPWEFLGSVSLPKKPEAFEDIGSLRIPTHLLDVFCIEVFRSLWKSAHAIEYLSFGHPWISLQAIRISSPFWF